MCGAAWGGVVRGAGEGGLEGSLIPSKRTQRRTYLRRKARLRTKRKQPRRSGRVRDAEYMERVRTLTCCCPLAHHGPPGSAEYRGETQAHHAGERPAGRKASDDTCIPMADLCHRDWHGAAGVFRTWSKDYRREWAEARIAETRAIIGHARAAQEAEPALGT